MDPHEVEKVLGGMQSTEEKPRLKIEFDVGDRVKINHGPFENFNGVVDEVNPAKGW
jgi:transcriptional antiterminator NusG